MPPRRAKSPSARSNEKQTNLSAFDVSADDGSLLHSHFGEATAAPAPTNKKGGGILSELSSVFLPEGYPHSVRPEYFRFQCYDTLQAACSYLRNILTTAAILRGSGVGDAEASAAAAAMAWVLRDGVGMFGSLIFSYGVGGGFDRNVKEWRLFADVINDVGLTLDMLAPLAGRGTGFTMVAALGAACKTICGMTAGATRASITAHFALQNNLADVSAKEGAQETAVTLLGLVLGSFLARQLGDSALTTWIAFISLTLLHVWANWKGVGCLALATLNVQRATIVCDDWVKDSTLRYPFETATRESPLGPLYLSLRGPRLGVSISALIDAKSDADGGAAALRALNRIFDGEEFLLRVGRDGRVCIALRPGATGATLLKALLCCSWLAARERTPGLQLDELQALHEAKERTANAWPLWKGELLKCGWEEAAVRLDHAGATRVVVEA